MVLLPILSGRHSAWRSGLTIAGAAMAGRSSLSLERGPLIRGVDPVPEAGDTSALVEGHVARLVVLPLHLVGKVSEQGLNVAAPERPVDLVNGSGVSHVAPPFRDVGCPAGSRSRAQSHGERLAIYLNQARWSKDRFSNVRGRKS